MLKKGLILLTVFLLTASTHTVSDFQSAETQPFSEILRPYKTIGPFMSRLQKLKERDLQDELETLWNLGKQGRLPLIENDPHEKGYRFITLVYRDGSKNKVGFEVFGIYDETCFGDMQLRRMKNTDLNYRCYKVPKDICFSYRFRVTDPQTGKTIILTDPFNPNRIPVGPSRNLSYSVLDMNEGERNWNLPPPKKTGSRTEILHYTDDVVGRKRTVSIYLPPGYQPDRDPAYPTLYLFDAPIYLNRVEVPNILDNLIEEGKIEPVIAVFFGTYRSTRDIILPLNFKFKNEFVSRFLPLIRSRYNTSKRPGENIIGGMSYGGLAGAFIAFYHPDLFGKVLSQSGSFWRGLTFDDEAGEWLRFDWLIERFLTQPTKKLIFYLDWGLQENWVLGSNRRMVRVLREKGYRCSFVEFNGWHDWSNSRKTFPHGLIYLLNPRGGRCTTIQHLPST